MGGRFFVGEVGVTHRKFMNGAAVNNVLATGVGEGLLTHALFDFVNEGHVNVRGGILVACQDIANVLLNLNGGGATRYAQATGNTDKGEGCEGLLCHELHLSQASLMGENRQ